MSSTLAKVEELKLEMKVITNPLWHESKHLAEAFTHKFEEQLDLYSVSDDAYELSHEINCKLEELLE